MPVSRGTLSITPGGRKGSGPFSIRARWTDCRRLEARPVVLAVGPWPCTDPVGSLAAQLGVRVKKVVESELCEFPHKFKAVPWWFGLNPRCRTYSMK
jgi:hypothetical protein